MSSSSGWPNASVRARHAAVSTPANVLDALTVAATGASADRVERVVDGYENEVYRVRTRTGHDVVIRIARFGGTAARSAGEAQVIADARAVGVPAPEVLLLDTVRIGDDTFPVMVQRAVPGRAIAEAFRTFTARQRHRVLVEVGELITRLNRLPADGDASAGIRSGLDRRVVADRDLVLEGGFSRAELDRMITLLVDYADQAGGTSTVMCHGDLSPKHLFVTDDAVVSGVIDFGDWGPGSPLHDLAVLRVRGPHLDLAPLLGGYGLSPDSPRRRQLDLHTLYVALPSLAIGVSEHDTACIDRITPQIRALLAALT